MFRRSTLPLVLAMSLVVAGCVSASDLADDDVQANQVREDARSGGQSERNGRDGSRSADKAGRRVELPNIVGVVRSFSSPTGNIGCYIGEDLARCDIRERTFAAPPKPDGCGLDWGQTLEVGSRIAVFGCVGDTVLGSRRILKYRTTTVVGDFGCTCARTGVTCVNRRTQHGFVISRVVARVF